MKATSRAPRMLVLAALATAVAVGCSDDDDDDVSYDGGSARDGGVQRDAAADAALDGSSGSTMDASRDAAGSLMDAAHDAAGQDAAARLSEGQVVRVAAVANMGEISQGQLALERATAAPVRDFAMMMVTAHTAAATRQTALANTSGISPQDSSVSAMLESEAMTMLESLRGAPAASFDRQYMDTQVTVHQRVLMLIDDVLLPSTTTAALRSELQTTRGDVQMHLTLARSIRDALADGGVASQNDASLDGAL